MASLTRGSSAPGGTALSVRSLYNSWRIFGGFYQAFSQANAGTRWSHVVGRLGYFLVMKWPGSGEAVHCRTPRLEHAVVKCAHVLEEPDSALEIWFTAAHFTDDTVLMGETAGSASYICVCALNAGAGCNGALRNYEPAREVALQPLIYS